MILLMVCLIVLCFVLMSGYRTDQRQMREIKYDYEKYGAEYTVKKHKLPGYKKL